MTTDHSPDNPTRAFYDRIASSYDRLADSNEQAARDAGLKLLAVKPGEKVLEIGYGTGQTAVELARAVGATGRVTGIDISPGMRAVAQSKVDEAGLGEQVRLEVGDALDMPYESDSFDVVTMSFTLELFPLETIPELLTDIRRVLKPGGRFGLVAMDVTPEGRSESLLTHVYKWMHHHFPHWVDCQPINVRKFVTDSGFQIQSEEEMEIWTLPVAILVASLG